ncbi:M43 family zinc metalloprotease [Aestuariivivens sediminis]|uniref:M43 family zinc metalloprotease n=1 Tax=Aestuariivivens sediminis TaxID=2913557 RepID=UPI001F587173|nr:M43 family zinc metalloprotease [Aestuariivivens sediminis]
MHIINSQIFKQQKHIGIMLLIYLLICSCSKDENEIISAPVDQVFRVPIVVHVLHNGEIIGEGSNLSFERVKRQIEILNEDFRRKAGTRGYNEHPESADAKIEFILAKKDPDGNNINGINRINVNAIVVPDLGYNQNNYAQYIYWNPNNYINIWTTPLPESSECLVLGAATGPETDLPGTELLLIPQEGDSEGILINWMHFGESNIDCKARLGRTLTHEMGHYFGLLHTWGGGDCLKNDYCDDTPSVDKPVYNSAFMGCNGEHVMVNNYMNWSDDDLMNIFTNDQINRMHYVLQYHEGRHDLLSSPALK